MAAGGVTRNRSGSSRALPGAAGTVARRRPSAYPVLGRWPSGGRGATLHALGQRHAEQAEAGGQRAEHGRAQREAGLPDLVVLRLEDRALLVERGEQAGDLEEVSAQLVRLGGVGDLGDDRAEAE